MSCATRGNMSASGNGGSLASLDCTEVDHQDQRGAADVPPSDVAIVPVDEPGRLVNLNPDRSSPTPRPLPTASPPLPPPPTPSPSPSPPFSSPPLTPPFEGGDGSADENQATGGKGRETNGGDVGYDTKEVLVLDEIGFCEVLRVHSKEEESCNLSPDQVERDASTTIVISDQENVPSLELCTEIDDDALSIVCDDSEEDDTLLGNDCSKKRDWSLESRCGSKRKQDKPISNDGVPVVAFKQRAHSLPTPDEKKVKSRSFASMHNRLGKNSFQEGSGAYLNTPQAMRDLSQRPCFNFTKYGNCYRASCQFLHSGPSGNEEAGPNRHARPKEYSESDAKMDRASYCQLEVSELRQKVQDQHSQLQHQRAQLGRLRDHLEQAELGWKKRDSDQSQQMHEILLLLQQQQEELSSTKSLCQQMGSDSSMLEHGLELLRGRLRCLEASEQGHRHILSHYQFLADVQHAQLMMRYPGRAAEAPLDLGQPPPHPLQQARPELMSSSSSSSGYPMTRPNSATDHEALRSSRRDSWPNPLHLSRHYREAEDGWHCNGIISGDLTSRRRATRSPPVGLRDNEALQRLQDNQRVMCVRPVQQPPGPLPLLIDYGHTRASIHQPQ